MSVCIGYLAVLALTFAPAFYFTILEIPAWRAGQQPEHADSWGTLISLNLLLLGSGTLLLWHITKHLLVKFTDDGIWQRGILAWKFIAWKDVTHIKMVENGVHIQKAKQKVVVAPIIYSNWSEIAEFIRERVPSQSLRLR